MPNIVMSHLFLSGFVTLFSVGAFAQGVPNWQKPKKHGAVKETLLNSVNWGAHHDDARQEIFSKIRFRT